MKKGSGWPGSRSRTTCLRDGHQARPHLWSSPHGPQRFFLIRVHGDIHCQTGIRAPEPWEKTGRPLIKAQPKDVSATWDAGRRVPTADGKAERPRGDRAGPLRANTLWAARRQVRLARTRPAASARWWIPFSRFSSGAGRLVGRAWQQVLWPPSPRSASVSPSGG